MPSTEDDLRKQARTANKQDRELAEFMQILIKSPGWPAYQELIHKRIDSLGMEVLEPAAGLDRAIALEYQKGTMRGLIMARDLPNVTIAAMKDLTVPATENEDDDA